MIAALPAATVAALDRLWPVLPEARLVGGAVRDLLADRPVSDIDLATPEPPETVLARLADARIRAIATGLSHGTVTALIDGAPYEITTLRRDVETDGRHATVAWTTDWRIDAARRDFTINAMSLSRDGAVHDYFGGSTDLSEGRVRFVGDARTRIEEDGLRILRYFRFHARYGSGAPDPDAIAAIAASIACLAPLSVERIWSELERLLRAAAPVACLRLMRDTGVLAAILPGGADPEPVARLLDIAAPADPVLRLAALSRGNPVAVAAHLRLSNADAHRLRLLRSGPVPDPSMNDDDLRRLLSDDPADLLIDRSWLAPHDGAGLRARLAALPGPVFPLSGRDIVATGTPPGPLVGARLQEVRDWWRAGGCRADRTACLSRLDALPG